MSAVTRFNAVFERRDVPLVMADMTDDCVLESTAPAPDGRRHEGQQAVADVWHELFEASPTAWFDVEDVFAAGRPRGRPLDLPLGRRPRARRRRDAGP